MTDAGWYPDPWGQGSLRWWDGAQWTGHLQQRAERPFSGAFYLIAVLVPIVGVIMAIVRFAKSDIGNGIGLLITSIIASFVWLFILVALGAGTRGY